jgi:hypothetical protein
MNEGVEQIIGQPVIRRNRLVVDSKDGATLWVARIDLSPDEIESLTIDADIPGPKGVIVSSELEGEPA